MIDRGQPARRQRDDALGGAREKKIVQIDEVARKMNRADLPASAGQDAVSRGETFEKKGAGLRRDVGIDDMMSSIDQPISGSNVLSAPPKRVLHLAINDSGKANVRESRPAAPAGRTHFPDTRD